MEPHDFTFLNGKFKQPTHWIRLLWDNNIADKCIDVAI